MRELLIPIKSAVKPRANVNASGSCAACRDRPHDHRAKGIRALLGEEAAIRLSSSAFPDGGVIPRRFTCDGEDVSPPLEWTDVPSGARSLVLLCDDSDAPAGTWHHWAIYDIPPGRHRGRRLQNVNRREGCYAVRVRLAAR